MCSINIYVNQSPTTGPCFFSLGCSPQTTYAEIRNELYYRLQIYETQYNVDIRGRYNDIVNGRYESLFFPVNGEDEWRLFYHQTFETRGLQIIELHVDVIPLYGPGADLNPHPTHDAYNTPMSPAVENDESEDYVDAQDEDDEEGPMSYSDLSTGEDFSDVEDRIETEVPFNSNCDDDVYISGRTAMQHPVSALCDISDFQYVGMAESNLERQGELAPGRIFRSKKQLILAVCDYSCKKKTLK